MQGPQNPVQIVKGMKLSNTLRADKLNIESQRIANRQGVTQPVHFIFCIGQPE